MTKVLDAGLEADYQKSVKSLTKLVKITLSDGTDLGYNGFNRDLTYDDLTGGGPIVYKANRGAEISALVQQIGFTPDTWEAKVLLDDPTVKTEDLIGGRWDGAEFVMYEVNYENLTAGRHAIPEGGRGTLGTVTVEGNEATCKMRPLTDAYLTVTGRKITRKCVALFGETLLCGKRLTVPLWPATTAVTAVDPRNARLGDIVGSASHPDRYFECVTAGTTDGAEPTFDPVLGNITTETGGVQWRAERALMISATVDVVTSPRVFSLTVATDAPDAFLERGKIRGTDNENEDREMDIKSWDLATKTLSLALPLEYAVVAGDGFDVFAGCLKRREDCKAHRNIRNAKAMYDVPGADFMLKIARQSA